jgi:hypothetical protein
MYDEELIKNVITVMLKNDKPKKALKFINDEKNMH